MADLCSALFKAPANDSKGWGLESSERPFTHMTGDWRRYRQETSVFLHIFSLSGLVWASSQHSRWDPRANIPETDSLLEAESFIWHNLGIYRASIRSYIILRSYIIIKLNQPQTSSWIQREGTQTPPFCEGNISHSPHPVDDVKSINLSLYKTICYGWVEVGFLMPDEGFIEWDIKV